MELEIIVITTADNEIDTFFSELHSIVEHLYNATGKHFMPIAVTNAPQDRLLICMRNVKENRNFPVETKTWRPKDHKDMAERFCLVEVESGDRIAEGKVMAQLEEKLPCW